MALTWKVVNFEPQKMTIKLEFDNPLYISSQRVRDQLQLQILDNKLFYSNDSRKFIENETV